MPTNSLPPSTKVLNRLVDPATLSLTSQESFDGPHNIEGRNHSIFAIVDKFRVGNLLGIVVAETDATAISNPAIVPLLCFNPTIATIKTAWGGMSIPTIVHCDDQYWVPLRDSVPSKSQLSIMLYGREVGFDLLEPVEVVGTDKPIDVKSAVDNGAMMLMLAALNQSPL